MSKARNIMCAALAAAPSIALAQDQLWIRNFGTPQTEFAPALAPDGAGGAFIGGRTTGDLARPVQAADAWIARYGSDGNQLWIDQFGSEKSDETVAAAPDGAGGVFLGGVTRGSFGAEHAGDDDAWLAHHDGAALSWVRQLGTSEHDRLFALAPDGAGGLFVAGETYGDLAGGLQGTTDIWVARYDESGSQLWLRQFGTPGTDRASAMVADGAGGFFLAGATNGGLAGESAGRLDAWVGQFDADGEQMWLRQFGSDESDEATGVATDGAGGVLVTGYAWGAIAAPVVSLDHFIARHNAAGEVWIRQYGDERPHHVTGIAADGAGGAFLSGWSADPEWEDADVWFARHDADGELLWTEEFDVGLSDGAEGVATDGAGGFYIGGQALGDAWIAHYSDFCYADCDASGSLDFFDFLCFQNLFAAGDPEADCDGSGDLDFFDFLCFQNAFAAGCP